MPPPISPRCSCSRHALYAGRFYSSSFRSRSASGQSTFNFVLVTFGPVGPNRPSRRARVRPPYRVVRGPIRSRSPGVTRSPGLPQEPPIPPVTASVLEIVRTKIMPDPPPVTRAEIWFQNPMLDQDWVPKPKVGLRLGFENPMLV